MKNIISKMYFIGKFIQKYEKKVFCQFRNNFHFLSQIKLTNNICFNPLIVSFRKHLIGFLRRRGYQIKTFIKLLTC